MGIFDIVQRNKWEVKIHFTSIGRNQPVTNREARRVHIFFSLFISGNPLFCLVILIIITGHSFGRAGYLIKSIKLPGFKVSMAGC